MIEELLFNPTWIISDLHICFSIETLLKLVQLLNAGHTLLGPIFLPLNEDFPITFTVDELQNDYLE